MQNFMMCKEPCRNGLLVDGSMLYLAYQAGSLVFLIAKFDIDSGETCKFESIDLNRKNFASEWLSSFGKYLGISNKDSPSNVSNDHNNRSFSVNKSVLNESDILKNRPDDNSSRDIQILNKSQQSSQATSYINILCFTVVDTASFFGIIAMTNIYELYTINLLEKRNRITKMSLVEFFDLDNSNRIFIDSDCTDGLSADQSGATENNLVFLTAYATEDLDNPGDFIFEKMVIQTFDFGKLDELKNCITLDKKNLPDNLTNIHITDFRCANNIIYVLFSAYCHNGSDQSVSFMSQSSQVTSFYLAYLDLSECGLSYPCEKKLDIIDISAELGDDDLNCNNISIMMNKEFIKDVIRVNIVNRKNITHSINGSLYMHSDPSKIFDVLCSSHDSKYKLGSKDLQALSDFEASLSTKSIDTLLQNISANRNNKKKQLNYINRYSKKISISPEINNFLKMINNNKNLLRFLNPINPLLVRKNSKNTDKTNHLFNQNFEIIDSLQIVFDKISNYLPFIQKKLILNLILCSLIKNPLDTFEKVSSQTDSLLIAIDLTTRFLEMQNEKIDIEAGNYYSVNSDGQICHILNDREYSNMSLYDLYLFYIISEIEFVFDTLNVLQKKFLEGSSSQLIHAMYSIENFKNFKNILMNFGLYRTALNFFDYESNFDSHNNSVILKKILCLLMMGEMKTALSIYKIFLDIELKTDKTLERAISLIYTLQHLPNLKQSDLEELHAITIEIIKSSNLMMKSKVEIGSKEENAKELELISKTLSNLKKALRDVAQKCRFYQYAFDLLVIKEDTGDRVPIQNHKDEVKSRLVDFLNSCLIAGDFRNFIGINFDCHLISVLSHINDLALQNLIDNNLQMSLHYFQICLQICTASFENPWVIMEPYIFIPEKYIAAYSWEIYHLLSRINSSRNFSHSQASEVEKEMINYLYICQSAIRSMKSSVQSFVSLCVINNYNNDWRHYCYSKKMFCAKDVELKLLCVSLSFKLNHTLNYNLLFEHNRPDTYSAEYQPEVLIQKLVENWLHVDAIDLALLLDHSVVSIIEIFKQIVGSISSPFLTPDTLLHYITQNNLHCMSLDEFFDSQKGCQEPSTRLVGQLKSYYDRIVESGAFHLPKTFLETIITFLSDQNDGEVPEIFEKELNKIEKKLAPKIQ